MWCSVSDMLLQPLPVMLRAHAPHRGLLLSLCESTQAAQTAHHVASPAVPIHSGPSDAIGRGKALPRRAVPLVVIRDSSSPPEFVPCPGRAA